MWAYAWTWEWEAKYFVVYDPDAELPVAEEQLKDKVRNEVSNELESRFLDEGHPLEDVSVDTDVEWICVAEPEPPWELNYYYRAEGKTCTKFRTDIPASPVNPLILEIIYHAIPYICAVLVAFFAWLGLREIGTILSETEPIEEFCCGICGECFTTAGALDVHMRDVHGVTQFTCPYCGAVFSTSQELYEHIERVHGGFKIPWGLIALLVGAGLVYLFYKEWKKE